MLRVCTIMNRVEDHYPELEQSCIDRDIPIYAYIRTGRWTWLGKVMWELELCEMYPEDTFVFVDAFDVLCVADRDELEAAANAHDLIFQADKNLGVGPWPLKGSDKCGEWDSRRDKETVYNYLNGSGPVGKGLRIAEAIKDQLAHEPFYEPGTDQLFWQRYYLRGNGVLDQHCTIATPLWGAEEGDLKFGRDGVINNITGKKTQFIHATGRTWAWIPEELKPNVENL